MRFRAISLFSLSAALLAGSASATDVMVYFGVHGLTAADVRPGQPVPPTGIYAARFNDVTGKLTPLGLSVELGRPTWLVASPDKPIIYAANELGNDGKSDGQVVALTPDGDEGKLKILSQIDAKGGGTTHLTYDAKSHSLFAANYGNGQAVSFPVNADGTIGDAVTVDQHEGTGPSPRQKGPHAHGVTVDPSGQYVLSPDLGADRVFISRIDATTHQLTPATTPFEAVTAGSGPRHLIFSPNGKFAYLNTELTAELRVYAWDAAQGRLTSVQTLSTVAKDFYGKKSAGEITLSKDGRFFYVSNRGEDTVAVYAVSAKTGKLTEIQRISTQGDQPWHFTIDPTGNWFLIANEASSSVAVFKRDPKTGKLSPSPSTVDLPKPVNILFGPQ